MATGGCLCGKITYQTNSVLRPIVACHCSQCRKTSGHHVAATSALKSEMTISGDVSWYQSSPAARRGFCSTCGSNLFWESATSERISIFAGTLDHTEGLKLAGHIFVADKANYVEFTDGLPQAPGDDPDLTTA